MAEITELTLPVKRIVQIAVFDGGLVTVNGAPLQNSSYRAVQAAVMEATGLEKPERKPRKKKEEITLKKGKK